MTLNLLGPSKQYNFHLVPKIPEFFETHNNFILVIFTSHHLKWQKVNNLFLEDTNEIDGNNEFGDNYAYGDFCSYACNNDDQAVY